MSTQHYPHAQRTSHGFYRCPGNHYTPCQHRTITNRTQHRQKQMFTVPPKYPWTISKKPHQGQTQCLQFSSCPRTTLAWCHLLKNVLTTMQMTEILTRPTNNSTLDMFFAQQGSDVYLMRSIVSRWVYFLGYGCLYVFRSFMCCFFLCDTVDVRFDAMLVTLVLDVMNIMTHVFF